MGTPDALLDPAGELTALPWPTSWCGGVNPLPKNPVSLESILRASLSPGPSTLGLSTPTWKFLATGLLTPDCQRRRNRGGNGVARLGNAETAGTKVSFRPRNNTPSLSAGYTQFCVAWMQACSPDEEPEMQQNSWRPRALLGSLQRRSCLQLVRTA